MSQRLYRSTHQRMFLGVCGGIAERYDLDPTIVRLAFVLALFTGPGLFAYLISALIIPRTPALGAGITTRQLSPSSAMVRR